MMYSDSFCISLSICRVWTSLIEFYYPNSPVNSRKNGKFEDLATTMAVFF
jgi:hypothetical protein